MADAGPRSLLSPAEAERLVAEAMPRLGTDRLPLDLARGRVLREDVIADRPLPPFDRVTLDGYALRAADAAGASAEFTISGFQPAGHPPLSLPASPGHCIEVATGAVLPDGADCVVPYEKVERADNRVILRCAEAPRPGDAVHARGSDRQAGSLLLRSGARLRGRELAVAASCGRTDLLVSSRPRIGLLVTGDELADPGAPVMPWQQRRSNDVALRSVLEAAGAEVRCRHVGDDATKMGAKLAELLEVSDFVVTTGGVSKGRLDLLPDLLSRAGATSRFHGVAQRPGKPLWFGLSGGRPVFGLPGNPVSSFVCLHRYVLPALGCAAGAAARPVDFVPLVEPVRSDRVLTLYVPAVLVRGGSGGRMARLVPTNTSGDLTALVDTDGFVEIPPDGGSLPAGFLAPFRPWA